MGSSASMTWVRSSGRAQWKHAAADRRKAGSADVFFGPQAPAVPVVHSAAAC